MTRDEKPLLPLDPDARALLRRAGALAEPTAAELRAARERWDDSQRLAAVARKGSRAARMSWSVAAVVLFGGLGVAAASEGLGYPLLPIKLLPARLLPAKPQVSHGVRAGRAQQRAGAKAPAAPAQPMTAGVAQQPTAAPTAPRVASELEVQGIGATAAAAPALAVTAAVRAPALLRPSPRISGSATAPSPAREPVITSRELTLLREARGALDAGRYADAERWARAHAKEFPGGPLAHERNVVLAMSQCQAGRGDSLALSLLANSPNSLFAARLSSACTLADRAAASSAEPTAEQNIVPKTEPAAIHLGRGR